MNKLKPNLISLKLAFPVIKPINGHAKFVDWHKLDNAWAIKVHGQSLQRLAERGGLNYIEIYWNLHKLRWDTPVALEEALKAVDAIIYE